MEDNCFCHFNGFQVKDATARKAIEDHTKGKNPHGLTAADVGAAPAGYGLGGGSLSIDDANAVAANGWYFIGAGTVNKPEHLTYGTLFHKVRTTKNMMQEVIDIYGIMAVRTLKDGVWTEWEYVNPPMHPGVEYRTTERFNGKSVYAKLFNSTVSASTTTTAVMDIPHGIENFGNVVRCTASLRIPMTEICSFQKRIKKDSPKVSPL